VHYGSETSFERLSYASTKGAGLSAAGVEVGSTVCFDDINLTGVNSVDVSFARNAPDVSAVGRFALLWGSADVEVAQNLGEKLTTTSGGWEIFQTLSVGLSEVVNDTGLLCFRGLQGNGILNINSFTLSATPASNDGVTSFVFEPPVGPPVDPITVQDGQVMFGGQARSIAGNSMFWSNGRFSADTFYNANVVKWLKDDWNSQIIRAAMAVDDNKPGGQTLEALGGYITNPFENKLNVQIVVNAAIENGQYAIIDWHAHKAEDFEQEAIAFFQEMASDYGTYNNVIYEIYNEPVFTSWTEIKRYAENVIAAIRAIDQDNLIIVGTRNYSQEVEEAADNPITAYGNIAYTLHFYAATHKADLRDKAQRAVNKGIALFVTEWGTVEASGNGNVDTVETNLWMNFLRANNISHVNWAVHDLPQGSAIVTQGASVNGNWSPNQLTPSGTLVKSIIQNW
jgi:hypothetical protein